MSKGNPNPDTSGLKPIKSKKIARKLGAIGGKKSGESKREKKLLSQIYAKMLAEDYDLDGNGKTIEDVAREVLNLSPIISPSSKVSMLKEIREATEGQKVELSNPDGTLRTEGIKVEFIVNNNSNECPAS